MDLKECFEGIKTTMAVHILHVHILVLIILWGPDYTLTLWGPTYHKLTI